MYTRNACACLVRTVYKLIMNFQIIRYIVAFVECVKKKRFFSSPFYLMNAVRPKYKII